MRDELITSGKSLLFARESNKLMCADPTNEWFKHELIELFCNQDIVEAWWRKGHKEGLR